MKAKPVRRYPKPQYPTRLEIVACPELLRRRQPPAWRQLPGMAGAVGLFLCVEEAMLKAADSPAKGGPSATSPAAAAIVAPIFKHGEGRGTTGCVVMSPPVFLSEEEAMQVVREEMAAKGVRLGTNKVVVAGVDALGVWKKAEGEPLRPFAPDGADAKRKVAVEFVGEYDAQSVTWEKRMREMEERPDRGFTISTVASYDLPEAAEYVRNKVKRQATDKVYFGAFYDPLAGTKDFGKASAPGVNDAGKLLRKMETEAKAQSCRLLRLQVQDFVKWLQGQGVI
jgi:hypothetical protein